MPRPTPPESRVHAERDRAESFGSVAENYDRFRPSYPQALVDDLVATGAADVLDVGCGTGKGARLLAERGLSVLGVEVDARMAEVARSTGIPVEVASFETWDAADRTFDLITAAQSWHWIDPAIGVPKAAQLLRPGGFLALFWNHSAYVDPAKEQFDAIYTRLAPSLLEQAEREGGRLGDHGFLADVRDSGLFAAAEERNYTRTLSYSAEDWIGMIGTHSDHLKLPAPTRAALNEAVREMVTATGGEVTVETGTYLVLARR